MLWFYCTQTHEIIQYEFSREFLKTIFARLPPLASAARCGAHPRTSLATPVRPRPGWRTAQHPSNNSCTEDVLQSRLWYLKTHRVVLRRLESRKVLEHRWRLADQPLQRIQVDQVLPAALKDLESLEVRTNQQVLAAHRAPANLSTK